MPANVPPVASDGVGGSAQGSRTSKEKLAETGLKHSGKAGSVATRPMQRPIGHCDGQATGTSSSPGEQRARHTSAQAPCRSLLENGRDGRKSECGRCFEFRDSEQSSVNSKCRPTQRGRRASRRHCRRRTGQRTTHVSAWRRHWSGEADCCSQRRSRSTYARPPTRILRDWGRQHTDRGSPSGRPRSRRRV